MNTFNKKSLFVALASLGALGVTGTADAVYVNPDGTGQVLIYPYYTVRNKLAGVAPFNSLLSVVNSSGSAKAVKVRFLEGKNSLEVLDFNLYLSAYDVWTTAIIPVGDGAGIITSDNSCTTPAVGRTVATATPFVNFAYSGDPAGGNMDRTTEGYVEIIEMGNLVAKSSMEAWVTHGADGVPAACDEINDDSASRDTTQGGGGLFGGITLVNVLAGEDFTADAVALQDWNNNGSVWEAPGSALPDLRSGGTDYSVFTGSSALNGSASSPIDAVSAVLMHDSVMNEFVLDAATLSQTSWVVTYPTKRFYYDQSPGQLCGAAQTACYTVLKNTNDSTYLFQRNFGATGACDDVGTLDSSGGVSLSVYDREERTPKTPGGFSPPPPTGKTPALCWEANIVTFAGKNVFGSQNTANVPTTYPNGWMYMNLVGNQTSNVNSAKWKHLLPTPSATFFGLPVIRFAVQSFNNGTLTDPSTHQLIQSQYGGNFGHKYSTWINW